MKIDKTWLQRKRREFFFVQLYDTEKNDRFHIRFRRSEIATVPMIEPDFY